MGSPTPGTLTDGEWAGQPCFIVGGGESLKGFDFNRLWRAGRIIVINRAFESVPFADIIFFMDKPYYEDILRGKYGAEVVAKWQAFRGRKVFVNLSGDKMGPDIISVQSSVTGIHGAPKPISAGLYNGNCSGSGAIYLAVALGADPIYLLGYDCKGKHFHDGYGQETGDRVGKIFADSLAELAKHVGPSYRILNLNSDSASRAFPFGDADKILPVKTEADPEITVITPTGDRPLAFRLCQQWMANQTLKPGQWIVVDDGKMPLTPTPAMQYIRREPRPDDPKHTLDLNMRTALPLIKGSKILIMEDDEYYAPRYLEEMAKRLDQVEVVGIMRAKYYHLPTGGYVQIGNTGHASLAETGFRRSFLPVFEQCINRGIVPNWLDEQIWRTVNESKKAAREITSLLFVDDGGSLYAGIKGLPGRNGMGQGHNPAMYHNKDTIDRAMLKRWTPGDYQIYLDILGGKLTTGNYRSYFPADLPITGITVCWNTKDLIERAYNSIRKFYPDMPIIIVDGSDSRDPCASYVRGLASELTTIIQPGHNIGHGRGMCLGIEKAKTPYALIFDSDIELLEPCIPAMLAMMEEDTFGVGYIEKIGYDGFVYGAHPHPEGSLPCLHPYFHLIDIRNYKKYYPYVHHGMPVYLTMLDIHKKELSGKIIKQFPGLVNHAPDSKFVRHDTSCGTGDRRKALGLPHIEGAWVRNQGLV